MRTLTFAFDCQLNDEEDFIAEGQRVKISDNPYHLARHEDAVPVIITEGYDYNENKIGFEPHVVWFDKRSFVECQELAEVQ